MITFNYMISDVSGLHARNALQIARAAEGYQCRIKVSSGGKTANGKQVLSLISLAAKKRSRTGIFSGRRGRGRGSRLSSGLSKGGCIAEPHRKILKWGMGLWMV